VAVKDVTGKTWRALPGSDRHVESSTPVDGFPRLGLLAIINSPAPEGKSCVAGGAGARPTGAVA